MVGSREGKRCGGPTVGGGAGVGAGGGGELMGIMLPTMSTTESITASTRPVIVSTMTLKIFSLSIPPLVGDGAGAGLVSVGGDGETFCGEGGGGGGGGLIVAAGGGGGFTGGGGGGVGVVFSSVGGGGGAEPAPTNSLSSTSTKPSLFGSLSTKNLKRTLLALDGAVKVPETWLQPPLTPVIVPTVSVFILFPSFIQTSETVMPFPDTSIDR